MKAEIAVLSQQLAVVSVVCSSEAWRHEVMQQ